MRFGRLPSPRTDRMPIALAMAVLPIVTLLAGWSFAAAQADPTANAESRFLAFLLALGVTAIVGLERRHGHIAAATAGFGLLVLWTVGTGPVRGAALAVLLIAGVGLAATAGWRYSAPRDAVWIYALALAVQALARPRLLLAVPAPEALLALLGLPLLAAVAWLLLARATGEARALLVIGTIMLFGPGCTVTTAAIALAVAMAAQFRPAPAAAIVADRWLGWIGAWVGALGVLTLLLAAYPFARRSPLADALGLLGLDASARGAVVAAVLVSFAGGSAWLLERARRPAWAGAVATLGLTSLILVDLAIAGGLGAADRRGAPREVFVPATELRADRGSWRQGLAAAAAPHHVTIDSSAIASLGLEAGRPIADVLLTGDANQTLASVPLVIGRDTAEWAAERPDVADRLGQAPQRSLAFVAPAGGFFGRRFRARLEIPGAAEDPGRGALAGATRLVVRRRDDLPQNVRLMLYRVEVEW